MIPPDHLPAHLRPIWQELLPNVHPRIGPAGLEALAGAVHRARDARAQIDNDGLTVADPKGNAIAHPALAIEKSASAEIRAWLKEYGITPTSK